MAAARALAKKARKGSIAHFQEAANRLEGRIPDADESRGDVVFNVVISAPRPHRPAIEVWPTTPRELDSGGQATGLILARGLERKDGKK